MNSPIRVAFNASSLLLPHTGIASYSRNLAFALRETGQIDLKLFYRFRWSDEIRSAAMPGAASLRDTVLSFIPRPYWLKRLGLQQARFSSGVKHNKFDLYHEPSFLPFRFPGPTVITIHDLSPLRFPETHPPERVRQIKTHLPAAVSSAALILVDSHFVKHEVVELLGVHPSRIRPVHLGVSNLYRPRPAAETGSSLAAYGLSHGSYILAVGTLEPRKNLLHAIRAHFDLPQSLRDRFPLVMVGTKGWLSRQEEAEIGAAQRRGNVRWLGYVPEADLSYIYSGAAFLVYPSLYEGFGLPVLEGMASGIPVITSDRSSLPEVAGLAGIRLDPRDRAALRDAMVRLLEDPAEAQARAIAGLAQAAGFSWARCAEQTLAVYKEVLSGQ